MQGIFREYSGNMQGTFREHAGNLQGIFREHSGNLQGTFREPSGNIQGTFRERSGNIQGTFREHSGNIQGTFKEHLGNTFLVSYESCRVKCRMFRSFTEKKLEEVAGVVQMSHKERSFKSRSPASTPVFTFKAAPLTTNIVNHQKYNAVIITPFWGGS
jgi:hypothetical protein